MKINQALEHYKWRLSSNKNTTQKDIDSYNSIIDFKEQTESKNLSENQSLAKLFIAYFMMLSKKHDLTSAEAKRTIEDILKRSTYEWCCILHNQIKVMHIGTIGADKYPIDLNEYNITKIDERNKKVVNEFTEELSKALNTEVEIDSVIKFVESTVTDIINTYENDNI